MVVAVVAVVLAVLMRAWGRGVVMAVVVVMMTVVVFLETSRAVDNH